MLDTYREDLIYKGSLCPPLWLVRCLRHTFRNMFMQSFHNQYFTLSLISWKLYKIFVYFSLLLYFFEIAVIFVIWKVAISFVHINCVIITQKLPAQSWTAHGPMYLSCDDQHHRASRCHSDTIWVARTSLSGVIWQHKCVADEQQHDKLIIVKVTQRQGHIVHSIDCVTLSWQDI